jgi:AraC-like DNA-binding protein
MRVEQIARDASSWELASRAPCALLRRHVRSLVGFDERSLRPFSRREFPEPWLVSIIEFGPPLRVTLQGDSARNPGGFAAGLGDQPAITQHDGHSCGVQVDLTPTGARRLFGIPMSELSGRIVGLRELFPLEHDALTEQLAAASDWALRLDLVEAFLLRHIDRARIDTARVDWALARIEERRGLLDVGSLAQELGYSHKHLIALFHDQVGIPPKLLARLVRFERAMRAARAGGAIGWADLALAHGYFDQAHLARDVKRFTGLTPSQVRALPLPVNSVQEAPRS